MSGLVVLIISLILSALFSAIETALSGLNVEQRARIRQNRPLRAARLDALLASPERAFNAIIFGNLIVNTTACVAAYWLALRAEHPISSLVVFPTMIAALYLFGEVLPKSLAAEHAATVASATAPFLSAWTRLNAPLLGLGERLAQQLGRACTPPHWLKAHPSSQQPTPDEYLDLLEEAERTGLVVGEERHMINRILNLGKLKAAEIMTPTPDMLTLDDAMTREQMAETLRRVKHRRVPIVSRGTDEVVGIINAREFLLNPSSELDEVIELPSFVPETMNVARLLQTFQRGGHKLAIVVDEYGGTAGIVTMEDILEQIVGEIEDEFDVRELLAQQLGDTAWLFNGKTRLDHVNELLGLNLSVGGADTLGGWFVSHFGALPKEGEQVRHEGFVFTARRVGKNRISEILAEQAPVTPTAPPSPPKTQEATPSRSAPAATRRAKKKTTQAELPFGEGGAP